MLLFLADKEVRLDTTAQLAQGKTKIQNPKYSFY
jgi:hypothetical protein